MRERTICFRAAYLGFALWAQVAWSQKMSQMEHSDNMPSGPSVPMTHAMPSEEGEKHDKVFQMPGDCTSMEAWDVVTAMCMPLAHGMAMTHVMLHGNVFGVGIEQSGPRGEDGFASTQMLMANFGRTVGQRHFFNVNIMGTFEKWTLPEKGYPLLLQTGESNREGVPYVDAQHPHSSPIMGLTFSDTLRIGPGKDHLKLFFAPRGQSTDGPIAFMHRPTGAIQPDAPLGHHIGQDVGHISSTVVGGLLRIHDTSVEISGFNGREPEPDKVDLPVASLNSTAFRITQYFSGNFIAMASVASVRDPHPSEDGKNSTAEGDASSFEESVNRLTRISASIYSYGKVAEEYDLHNTLIYGSVKTFGTESLRQSFAHEFALAREASTVFGRTEILQRMPSELMLSDLLNPNEGRWVGALTLGYSHRSMSTRAMNLNIGTSFTQYFMPEGFEKAYGNNPVAGKIFLQLSGMKMWTS